VQSAGEKILGKAPIRQIAPSIRAIGEHRST
jgi:hypothetical protein